ncbi:MAG TPA: TIGR03067 domain-containing protein [Isosphaeraceae bacterium]|jgi:uncharacterized protein (TIGR03067 family)
MPRALILFLLALAPPDGPGADEPAKHQGTWTVVSQVRDGKEAPADVVRSIRRVVEGDHVTWTRDGKSFAGTKIEYDVTRTPHALDLIPDGGPNRGKHVLGIYKLESDELVICVADTDGPRPTDFDAPAGSKRTLQKFRRIRARDRGNAEERKRLDLAKLRGTWTLLALEREKKTFKRDVPMQMLIEGDRKIFFVGGAQNGDGWDRIELDPTRSPAEIDVMLGYGPNIGRRLPGIYRLEGDRLTICLGVPEEPRPVVFESKVGSMRMLYSFVRADP